MSEERERLDLVIPVYNEAHVLESTVSRLLEASSDWPGVDWRIEIADNASVDGTEDVGRRLAAAHDRVGYRRIERKGRGHALRESWSGTDAPYSLYMDVDLSTDLSAIPVALRHLRDGADLVTGSRLDPGAEVTRSPRREVFSRAYNAAVKLFFSWRTFRDSQCGFKGVRVEVIRSLLPFVRNNHWFFDTELMLLAQRAGLSVRSFPVRWVEDTDSRVVISRYAVESLKGLLRMRRTVDASVREWKRVKGARAPA